MIYVHSYDLDETGYIIGRHREKFNLFLSSQCRIHKCVTFTSYRYMSINEDITCHVYML